MDDHEGRVAIRKMYKLYVNGAFARSESARSDNVDGENVAHASRKDVRDAVLAARAGTAAWSAQSPALRGLVLYRLAEMMEGRAAELAAQLVRGGTVDEAGARAEVTAAIDRTVWYAGWCDKYVALASTRNPVAGPHFNFSTTEPTGVVAVIAPAEPALLGLVTAVVPALVSGNAVVVVASERDPRTAIVFAECLAGHMDVNALLTFGLDVETVKKLGSLAAENVKRTHFEPTPERAQWFMDAYNELQRVLDFTEVKTIWHPARI
jgi:acyl-CoA reductase-like NAD-dependent aldehyde dehydrogenase